MLQVQPLKKFFFRLNFFFFFLLFRAAPMAYGSSQARGLIRATDAAFTRATAMQDPSHICDFYHMAVPNPWQCQILSPLGGARD